MRILSGEKIPTTVVIGNDGSFATSAQAPDSPRTDHHDSFP